MPRTTKRPFHRALWAYTSVVTVNQPTDEELRKHWDDAIAKWKAGGEHPLADHLLFAAMVTPDVSPLRRFKFRLLLQNYIALNMYRDRIHN